MRKIKFKAIDQFSDDFIIGQSFYIDSDNNQGYISDGIDRHYLVLKETICQYTGFKDKNGQEIYDGDIIGDWELVDGKKVQSKLQVFFDEKLCQWMLDCSSKQDKSTFYALFKELEDFEYKVIGNTHNKNNNLYGK